MPITLDKEVEVLVARKAEEAGYGGDFNTYLIDTLTMDERIAEALDMICDAPKDVNVLDEVRRRQADPLENSLPAEEVFNRVRRSIVEKMTPEELEEAKAEGLL